MINFGQYKPKEIARFIVGGLISLSVCYTSLYFLVEIFGVNYLLGTNLAAAITFFFSYIVNKYFVFQDRRDRHITQGSRFIFLQIFLAILANITLIVGVELAGINYFILVVLLGPILASVNYLAQKTVVFNR